jgi:hypothetical protein
MSYTEKRMTLAQRMDQQKLLRKKIRRHIDSRKTQKRRHLARTRLSPIEEDDTWKSVEGETWKNVPSPSNIGGARRRRTIKK